ncbi:oxidoreductase [Methanocella sp. CWC-04]|uniref:Oxidoreductase n=2 Tax=Methanooceanicella nereidis TaxID=2052831 RepID=A0AAP2W7E1_9EURY|nr:oxidoreductase [Methanocella sp. CWC-04]
MIFETKVEQVIQRTHDTKSFRFKKPEGWDHLAGQWMYVSLKIDGNEARKHFTISSSPTENYLEFTKKIRDSDFSQALNRLKGGEWVKLEGPFGSFYFSGQYPKIGMLSGGIGITPLRSICKYCTDKKLSTDIVMLYSNKTSDDIVFRDQFEEMQRQNPHIRVMNVLTREPSWQGLKGHIDAKMIKEQIPDHNERVFYICGPPQMVSEMQDILTEELGMPDSKVKVEYFTGYER